MNRQTECSRCGRSFHLGWRVTIQGSTRVATIASRPTDRGVTCKTCAAKRVEEMDRAARAARAAR